MFFLIEMNEQTASLKTAWNKLSKEDKSVVRFYLQLPLDELEKKGIQQGELYQATRANNKKPTFAKQSMLYFLAYGMKKKGITNFSGGRTRRGKKTNKRKGTRRH